MQTLRHYPLALSLLVFIGCASAEQVDDSVGLGQSGSTAKGGGTNTGGGTNATGSATGGGAAKGGTGAGGVNGTGTVAKGGSTGGRTTATRVPSCTDLIKNGDETDVDCGGTCETKCAFGKACTAETDCVNSIPCAGGKCTTCASGAQDGDETDVDCGGSCAKCAEGLKCLTRTDCATYNCAAGVCGVATSCLAVIEMSCACDKMVVNASDASGCQKVLDCFLANECGPSDACAASTAACGNNTLGVDDGKYSAAKKAYTCNCPVVSS